MELEQQVLSLVWFSTITTTTQVLAALVGLFAVFVVYKIQDTSRLFEDVKSGVARLVASYADLNPAYPENISLIDAILISDDELLVKFAAALKRHEGSSAKSGSIAMADAGADPTTGLRYGFNRETHDIYKKMLDNRRDIIRELKFGIILSFLEIAFCIILLTLSSHVMSERLLWLNAFFAIVVLSMLARATYRVAAK
jgi:hypothetical protein